MLKYRDVRAHAEHQRRQGNRGNGRRPPPGTKRVSHVLHAMLQCSGGALPSRSPSTWNESLTVAFPRAVTEQQRHLLAVLIAEIARIQREKPTVRSVLTTSSPHPSLDCRLVKRACPRSADIRAISCRVASRPSRVSRYRPSPLIVGRRWCGIRPISPSSSICFYRSHRANRDVILTFPSLRSRTYVEHDSVPCAWAGRRAR